MKIKIKMKNLRVVNIRFFALINFVIKHILQNVKFSTIKINFFNVMIL